MPCLITGIWYLDNSSCSTPSEIFPEPLKSETMKLLLLALSTAISFTVNNSFAQVKWEGKAGDGLWATASNWVGNSVPGAADNVLLDNTYVEGSYTVYLPSSPAPDVILNSLKITPSLPNIITVILPKTDTSRTALQINGPGDAFVLDNGAVFINSSGAIAGTPVSVTTANFFRINNGGRYIHNTPRGHTDHLVSRLSKASGTENGVFEFDVPVAGYTVSISDRTFGSLVFSSTSSGGKITYSGNSSKAVIINGDLVVNAGASFSIDVSNDLIIRGNFTQASASVFNISNKNANTVVKIYGDISSAGVITHTGSGSPAIQLSGTVNQKINVTGSVIGNRLDFELNNAAGATLLVDLTLPYRYSIAAGNLALGNHSLTTPSVQQLPSAPVQTNHIITNGKGYLVIPSVGSLKVRFPVGIDAESVNMIEIENGGGLTYSVRVEEGIKPTEIALPLIAVNRTWNILSGGTPASPVNVSFYFSYGEGNEKFDYSTNAEVGQYVSPVWHVVQNKIPQDFHHPFYSVAAKLNSFNSHFVVGNLHAILSHEASFLCKAALRDNSALVSWSILTNENIERFEIERSFNQGEFNPASTVLVVDERKEYSCTIQNLEPGNNLFRIKTVFANGKEVYSNIARLILEKKLFKIHSISPNPVNNLAKLLINSEKPCLANFTIYDVHGKIIKQWQYRLQPGPNFQLINVEHLRSGIYFIHCVDESNSMEVIRFIKQ